MSDWMAETEPVDEGVVAEQLTAALARQREPEIAEDFARRVSRLAVTQLPRRSSLGWGSELGLGLGPGLGWGPKLALVGGVLLTVALFAFAPHTRASVGDLRFDLEMLMLAELGGVGYVVTRFGLRE